MACISGLKTARQAIKKFLHYGGNGGLYYHMRTYSKFLSAVVVLAAALSITSTAQAVSNGGFEANGGAGFSDFTGWVTADEPGSSGSFFVQTGTGTPLFGNLVPNPPEGEFAAMTDSGGAGSHVLYQDFTVLSVTGTAGISFQVCINNLANDFFTPDSLDYTVDPNQQARVDLMLAGSDPFSVDPGDVLQILYQTNSGDPLTSGYNLVSADITSVLKSHIGERLRLRFAEVDNQQTLNFGVDDVALNGASVVPEPTAAIELTAIVLAAGSGLLSRRRYLRRQTD